jgi:hypothetical protein
VAAGADDVVAGAELAVVAGVVDGVLSAVSALSSPLPIADRRSRDRFRRCSGISVTAPMIDAHSPNPGICAPIPVPDPSACPSPIRHGSPSARGELVHNLAKWSQLRARLRISRPDDYSSEPMSPPRHSLLGSTQPTKTTTGTRNE